MIVVEGEDNDKLVFEEIEHVNASVSESDSGDCPLFNAVNDYFRHFFMQEKYTERVRSQMRC